MLKEALTTSSKFLQIKEDLNKGVKDTSIDIKINYMILSIRALCDLLHELAVEENAVDEYNKTVMGKGKC